MNADILKNPVKEGRKIVAMAESWVLPDRDEVLTMVVWKDGELTCYIEALPDDD